MKLNGELNLALKASKEAGTYLKRCLNRKLLSDEGKDIKLREDKKSDEIIYRYLSQTGIPIISEEQHNKEDLEARTRWVIDSLDGTPNFFRGIPFSSVSIALWEGPEPILGIVNDFNRRELYVAAEGYGAHCNGKTLRVSSISEKKQATFSTGFPPSMDFGKENLQKMISNFREYKKTRLFGCPSLSLAYVSSGKLDAYNESPINIWDVAAGLALVKYAGGEFNVKPLEKGKYDVFASNGKIKRD